MKKINKHIPVLLNETIKNLNLKDDGVYVDATLGMGGYTRKILDNSITKLQTFWEYDKKLVEDNNFKRLFSKQDTSISLWQLRNFLDSKNISNRKESQIKNLFDMFFRLCSPGLNSLTSILLLLLKFLRFSIKSLFVIFN